MTWRAAFFSQAWSDFNLFKDLNRPDVPLCHRLHYLQMATEKLAKGFLCSRKRDPPPPRHAVFVKFLELSKRRSVWRSKLGYGQNGRAYAAYVDSLIPCAKKIEDLAPEGGKLGKVNPEYPWIDASGTVQCPISYPFAEFDWRELNQIKFRG
ncbi:MAG: hypothetical protein V2B18_20305 [Pseudomonadota bacterium]